jgi:hypothetical protein
VRRVRGLRQIRVYTARAAALRTVGMPAKAARPPPEGPLSDLNRELERTGALPQDVWPRWLWQTDAEEPLSPSVLLNRSHLLGLLVCRHQARQQTPQPEAPPRGDERMRLMDKRPAAMSLRELRDTMDNLLLEWPQFLARLDANPHGAENLGAVVQLLDGCLARLGHLAEHPGDPRTFNDPASTEPHEEELGPDGEPLMRLSRPGLRRMLGAFLIMYRHLHLHSVAEPVPPEPFDCGLRKHHMEASLDDFNLLCMSFQLPVAARLTYKHDFPGMYNHVSQVRKKGWRARIRTRVSA